MDGHLTRNATRQDINQSLVKIEPVISQGDYAPLFLAIFVNLCIFLISANRPFGPYFNLGRDLTYARTRGQMQHVLGTFYRVFKNQFGHDIRPSPLQLIAPLQDVVFDYEGDYYAAVPLDFREENYLESLETRREGTQDNNYDLKKLYSLRPLETSRYISAVFVALEGENVIKLIGAQRPSRFSRGSASISEEMVREKLKRQGSIYARADAFRIYQFRPGAWATLQTAMLGSSAEEEEEAVRHRQRAK